MSELAINDDIFLNAFALLCTQHDRKVCPEQAMYYHKVLSLHLTTDEFKQAIEQSLFADNYWPTPAMLVEKVKRRVDVELLASTAWAIVSAAASNSKQEIKLDAAGKTALDAVGGLYTLGRLKEYDLQKKQVTFLNAYKLAYDGPFLFYIPRKSNLRVLLQSDVVEPLPSILDAIVDSSVNRQPLKSESGEQR